MSNDAPPRTSACLNLPTTCPCARCAYDRATPRPIVHSIRCVCDACCDARRDEAAARKEELAGRYSAFLERTMGPPTAHLGLTKARKPMPGSVQRIAARYGKVG